MTARAKKPVVARRKPVRRQPAIRPTLQTRIIFILDESGSMAHRTQMVIDGVNEYINRLKAENKENLDLFRLSIYKFDTRYRGIYEEMPLASVEPINSYHYNAAFGGSTALLDAVGRTLKFAGIGPDLKNLVIINTDGYENASQEFTKDTVNQLVREREESGMWTFVYLGAKIDAWAGASYIGTRTPGNSYSYDWSNHGVLYANLASATTRMSADASVTATASFLQDYTSLDVDNLDKPNVTDTVQPTPIKVEGQTQKKRIKKN